MSKSTITTAGINPNLYVLGSTQQFNYNQNLSIFRLSNSFTPTSLIPSQTNLEFRNNLFSGFRIIHKTTNTDTYGNLTLEKFVNASSSGTSLGIIVTAITTGVAATAGTATLNGTTGVSVSTTAVSTNSIINVTRNIGNSTTLPTNLGNIIVGDINNGTSFKIYSSNTLEIGTIVNWYIINP